MKSQSIGTMRERNEVLCSALQRERETETEGHARVAAVRRSDGDVVPFCDFFCTHHDASSVHSYFLLLLFEHRFVSGILKFIIIIIIIIISTITLSNCFKLFATECINHQYNDLQTCWPEFCEVEVELVKFFLWYRVIYMVPQETRSIRVLT